MTVVSFTHQVIFLKTRKTGGTSVELWLSSIAGRDDVLAPVDPVDEAARRANGSKSQNYTIAPLRYGARDAVRRMTGRRPEFYNHMPAEAVRAAVGVKVWDSFLKVTVERDRYDRAVSMFGWQQRQGPRDSDGDIMSFLRRFPTHKLANAPIYKIDGELVADVVLDFTHLADEVGALQRRLGVPEVPLPRAKSSTSRSGDSRTILGAEGCRVVDTICRHDVDLPAFQARTGEAGR